MPNSINPLWQIVMALSGNRPTVGTMPPTYTTPGFNPNGTDPQQILRNLPVPGNTPGQIGTPALPPNFQNTPPFIPPTGSQASSSGGFLSRLMSGLTNPNFLATAGGAVAAGLGGGKRAMGSFADSMVQQQQFNAQRQLQEQQLKAQEEERKARLEAEKQRIEAQRQQITNETNRINNQQTRELADAVISTGYDAEQLATVFGISDPNVIQASKTLAEATRKKQERDAVWVDVNTMKRAQPDPANPDIVQLTTSEWAKLQIGKKGTGLWWVGPKGPIPDEKVTPEMRNLPEFKNSKPLDFAAAMDLWKTQLTQMKPADQSESMVKREAVSGSMFKKPFAELLPDQQVMVLKAVEALTPRASGYMGQASDAQDIADDIIAGRQPPSMQGLYRLGGPVKAALARKDFDFTKATTEWNAVQKWVASSNSTQQLRMRQAVEKIEPHVEVIEGLYAQLEAKGLPTGFKAWNSAAISAATNLPGETGAIAQNLQTQIIDLSAELGNVYMGGNTPTDHALKQAAENLSAKWNPETFKMAVGLIKKNVSLRRNALRFTGPAGVPTDSPYYPDAAKEPQGSGGIDLSKFDKRKQQ